MRLKNKIIISFVFSVICVIFFKSNNMYALSQDEAGKYIAEFSINFFENYASQTIYSWYDVQRGEAYRGNKTSGVTSSGVSYSNKYAMDCVGWVSFAIHQSLGYGQDYFTFFGQPHSEGKISQVGRFFNGFSSVEGDPNSWRVISSDRLKQILKPGDLLLANRQHILIYVGNDEVIHCTGSGPGQSYGGNKGFGIVRNKLSELGYGIACVGRITDNAAKSINSANITTIFKGSGGITNKWNDSNQAEESYNAGQDNRIVEVEDKIPLYKHILLTEKYNFNNIKWKRYGHGYDGQDCQTQNELNLGLKYPKDEANTSLNDFINFSLPYLQTWMIPLSMNAGALTQGTQSNTVNNPMFSYLTIKKAMSKIIANRYDITTCVLTTKYKDYDVYRVKEAYKVRPPVNPSFDSEPIIERVPSADKEEFVKHVSEPEIDVGTKINIEPSYYIKQALVFDRKINNEFNYIKYSDDDVKNKVEDGVGYQGKQLRDGESINESGSKTSYDEGGYRYLTYEKKVGKYIYVDRTWKDELEVVENKSEPYELQDVIDYNLKDEDSESGSVVTDENGTNQSVQYNGKTITYSAKFASQTKSPEELGLKFEKITNGETTNYDACRVCNENVNQIGNTGIKLELGRKIVARWTKDSFVDYGDWVYIPGWGYALVADCGGFTGKASDKYHLDCFVGEEGDVIDDGQGNYSALQRRCINWKGVYERTPGSQVGVTIYRIKAEDIPKELLEGEDNSTQNDTTNDSEESDDPNEFSIIDKDYYKILKLDDELNRVDIMNSKPNNYLEYVKKGTEYSKHVGYSRAYLTFSYSNLRRLFDEYFGEKKTVPFAYGSTLGYDIYTGMSEIKGGKYTFLDSFGSNSGAGNGAQLVQVALGEVGYLEKRSNSNLDDKKANAGDNNYTKYGAWYGLNGGPDAPWCNIFVSWCAEQCGLLDTVIPKSAGCATTWEWYRSKGLTHLVTDSSYTPQPGDLVLRGPGKHIGIVEKYENGVLYTIEGNTSGQGDVNEGNGVYRKEYSNPSASWYGYCSPQYPVAGGDVVTGAVQIPEGLGDSYTVTYWNYLPKRHAPGKGSWVDAQGKLVKDFGGNPNYPITTGGDIKYDKNHMVKYGDWYAGAIVEFLGGSNESNCKMHVKIGDFMFIIKEDGSYFPLIVQDAKAQEAFVFDSNPANAWGHDNGHSVVEFETEYKYSDCGVYSKGRVAQIYRVGNIYSNKEYLYDLDKAVKDAGLDISKLIR